MYIDMWVCCSASGRHIARFLVIIGEGLCVPYLRGGDIVVVVVVFFWGGGG